MSKNILAIHGAFSTPLIWNFFKISLPEYKWHFVDYSNQTKDVSGIISDVEKTYANSKTQYHVIGHSMGGLVALALEKNKWVKSVTTIATPLNGLDLTLVQLYLSQSGFLGEIKSYGKFIESIHGATYTKPIQHLITTHGFNPWMFEASDGVVTLKSQRGWQASAATIHDIKANHSEVMLHPQTIEHVQNFLSTI